MEWERYGMQAARPQVRITRRACRHIRRFARGGDTVERGGFLVGLPPEASGCGSTLICGFLPARYSQGTPDTLTFTARTWADARARLSRRYPGLQLVGWMHTAPGTGAGLSEYDRFIQARYFGGAGQVACVVDPVRDEVRCFLWQEGQLVHCPDLSLADPCRLSPASRRALLAAGLGAAAAALALAAGAASSGPAEGAPAGR